MIARGGHVGDASLSPSSGNRFAVAARTRDRDQAGTIAELKMIFPEIEDLNDESLVGMFKAPVPGEHLDEEQL